MNFTAETRRRGARRAACLALVWSALLLWPCLALAAFPDGWERKAQITIDADEVDAALTDFPVLVSHQVLVTNCAEIMDADGGNAASSGGGDIRFSLDEAGATQLATEVVSFTTDNDPANGRAQIWVKVPSVSASVDTTIWIWWKKSGESQPAADSTYGSENVWDSNFALVMHMEQDPSGSAPQMLDSTSNGNHGTASGLVTGDLVAGIVGNGINFDAGAEYIEVPDDPTLDLVNNLTIELLADIASFNGGTAARGSLLSKFNSLSGGADNRGVRVEGGSVNLLYATESNANRLDVAEASVEGEHLITVRSQSGVGSAVYVDGVSADTGSELTAWFNTARALRIGQPEASFFNSGSNSADFTLSELRMSGIARSEAWIAATSSTLKTPGTFALAGTPQDAGGSPPTSTGNFFLLFGTLLFGVCAVAWRKAARSPNH